eukprot:m.309379 g.309379  ORF g.309379 m.309379 type:complete len:306 (+) comp46273_c0_seq1:21-938(+)
MAAKEDPDPDLDQLLDDALKDFDNPMKRPSEKTETSVDSHETDGSEAPDPLDDEVVSDEVARKAAEELDQAMNMLAGENPEMFRQIEQFAKGFEEQFAEMQQQQSQPAEKPQPGSGGAEATPESVQDQLKKTLEDLQKNAEEIKNTEVPSGSTEDQMMKAMAGMFLGGSGAPEGSGDDESGIIPMMQQMMKNLLSKDVLYPAIVDIRDKYPAWLRENDGKLPADQFGKYKAQFDVMKEVCDHFDSEKGDDSAAVKEKRFEAIVQLMQKMQEYGHPPADLIGGESPGFDFNMTKLPGLDGSKCILM